MNVRIFFHALIPVVLACGAGVITNPNCPKGASNHAVAIVGYGEDAGTVHGIRKYSCHESARTAVRTLVGRPAVSFAIARVADGSLSERLY